MSGPESDTRKPRKSVVEERETKSVKLNFLDGEESGEWVEAEEEWIHRRPREICSFPTTLKSNISRSRGFTICSTKG